MSGFGERFRAAGYKIPKPLIVVEDKPIIQHVVEMFPGDNEFIFVCNSDHLDTPEFEMRRILDQIGVKHKIVSIPPHKLGPVHAVMLAREYINPHEQTIVNYADFTCRWDFKDFTEFVSKYKPAGVVPAYKGFHPHSGGTTNYAYIQEEEGHLTSIREKQPFTSNKVDEYASSGTYYFESANLMIKYFEKQVQSDISVNGEYYASSAFDLMAREGRNVRVYPVNHFMQWGTPTDLLEYEFWSQKFHDLVNLTSGALPIEGVGTCLILASGLGSRFQTAGYETPKPILRVSGESMVSQVSKVATNPSTTRAISLKGSGIANHLRDLGPVVGSTLELEELSLGQADSARLLAEQIQRPVHGPITVLPSDTLFADSSGDLVGLGLGDKEDSLIVWVQEPSSFNFDNPTGFGWVGSEKGHVWSAIKESPLKSSPSVMTGAFTFSSIGVFEKLILTLNELKITVNGEQYLDSLVEVAIHLDVQVKFFRPSFSVSLGTPYEFETFRYWQACFEKWFGHKYALERDPFLDPRNIENVRLELETTDHSPGEWSLSGRL
jgi:NDP-sugar pyrophosphorylase family protein